MKTIYKLLQKREREDGKKSNHMNLIYNGS